jgi:hypothetical protein
MREETLDAPPSSSYKETRLAAGVGEKLKCGLRQPQPVVSSLLSERSCPVHNLEVINRMTDVFMRKSWLARAERKAAREAKRSAKTTRHVRNGDRECERRRSQIAAGRLTRSNGLSA